MSTDDPISSPRAWFERQGSPEDRPYTAIIDQLRLIDEDPDALRNNTSAKELWERQLIRDWRDARDEADRASRARDLMGRAAFDLRAGRALTAEMSSWLATALETGQAKGDADRAFGLKNPKHRPKKVVPVGLAYAAAIHALMVWTGLNKAAAAQSLHDRKAFHPEPRSLADAHADAEREFWIDGPFLLVRPGEHAQPFEVNRSRIASPDTALPAGCCIVVEFITRQPPRASWHIDVDPQIFVDATTRQ